MPCPSAFRRTGKALRTCIIITLVAFAISQLGILREANAQDRIPVDLQLVIALDVSTSMDFEERTMQRDGFVAAFRDAEIVRAIQSGRYRRIAVVCVEWAGELRQNVIVDWRLVSDAASAGEWADALERRIPGRLPMGTSISSALLRAASLFDSAGYVGARRVIDISGDGVNNRGPDPANVRDVLVARGITINGLPIVYKRLLQGVSSQDDDTVTPMRLVDYFHSEVIGGPGAFVEPVLGLHHFRQAIRRKLLREIHGTDDLAARRPADSARQGDGLAGALIAATTWPTAARSSAEAPPR